MGPQPVLGTEAENMLANWIKGLALRGFPVSRLNLITSVQQIVKDLHLESKFPNGMPGKKWLNLFLQRNPEISDRKPEKLSKVRANVTEQYIRSWFSEVKDYAEKNNLTEVLLDPSRIFNLDETAFFLCPKTGKVLGI